MFPSYIRGKSTFGFAPAKASTPKHTLYKKAAKSGVRQSNPNETVLENVCPCSAPSAVAGLGIAGTLAAVAFGKRGQYTALA